MSIDANDGSYDGIEGQDAVEAADANRPYGEVTAEESIEERLAQEQPDPAAEVAYGEEVDADEVEADLEA